GQRLDSSKNPGAYSRLVYPKGAYVIHMLRWMMYDPKTGDEAFIRMMHEFVKSHLNQNASTESFLEVVNKHITPAMDVEGKKGMYWFISQWIYGTDIPRYKFEYDVSQADGKYLVTASITQSEVSKNFIALVPIYAEIDGRLLHIGRVRMVGASTAPG